MNFFLFFFAHREASVTKHIPLRHFTTTNDVVRQDAETVVAKSRFTLERPLDSMNCGYFRGGFRMGDLDDDLPPFRKAKSYLLLIF